MKKALTTLGVALVLAGATGQAVAEDAMAMKGKAMQASPDKADFREVAPGIRKARIWGDDSQGAYGSYTRFRPGLDNGQHMHSNDIRIVVLEGAYLYEDEAGKKRVGPGDFMLVPGGKKHRSGGDAKDGALFYEEGTGKFDMQPMK